MKTSLILHWLLTLYLWLISWVSLGNFNAQPGPHLAAALRSGQHLQPGDIGFFAFVSLPAVLFTIAFLRQSRILVVAAFVVDLFWLALQIQSWWVPYLFGAKRPWQLLYARGITTKLLPSFPGHPAPDAMHTLITVFILAAITAAVVSLRQLRTH